MAFDAAAIDLAADKGACRSAEDGSGSSLTACVDCPAHQGPGCATDDQAHRSVWPLAAIAAMRVLPDAAMIIAVIGWGRFRQDRHGKRGGSERNNHLTHLNSLLLDGVPRNAPLARFVEQDFAAG